MEKSNKYLKTLYPEYDTFTQEKKDKLQGIINFITNHIQEIENWYEEAVGHGAIEGDSKIIEEAIRMTKSQIYKKMLYPDHSQLDPADRNTVINNELFIDDHVEEIECKYEQIKQDSNRQNFSDQEILKSILEAMQSEYITTQQIGQMTINASSIDKINAQQVEEMEESRITKEGQDLENN